MSANPMIRRIAAVAVPALAAGAALTVAAGPALAATPVRGVATATCSYGPCGTTLSVVVSASGNIESLQVRASGFAPGEVVAFTITNPARSVGALQASSTGTVSGTLAVPGAVPAGSHVLGALGQTSGDVASTTFTTLVTSGTPQPCAAAYTTSSAGYVLAASYSSASYVTAACITNQVPAAAGTPAAAGLPAGVASSGAASAAVTHGGSQLPFTGSNSGLTAVAGGAAVLAGGALVLAARRKREQGWK